MFNTGMFNTGMFDGAAPDNSDAVLNAQPIDITYQRQPLIFNNQRFRRESIAHLQGMGGVSWGSVTIGLWLKDEVMMQGAQNHPHHTSIINPRRGLFRVAQQHVLMSPPNATSYLPNLEADYCKDYLCCGQLLPTLHDLLRHYEEMHIALLPPHEPQALLLAHRSRAATSNIHNVMETVSTTDVFLHNPAHVPAAGSVQLPPLHFNLQLQTLLPGPAPTMLPAQAVHQPEVAPARRDDADSMYIDDPARHLYVMENEEYKPFKCPVIGCEKTYKNQNGLKYHRLHGHQNQTLKENEDGTFSIIDPESNAPYLDGAGMEKDKPYRCEVCGKRYKNLNGLKYHRGHTTH